MFSELKDACKQPVNVFFGVEGGWASNNLTAIKDVRGGTRFGIK